MSLLKHPFQLVLASKSPRRQQLLKDLGFNFSVRTLEVEENHEAHLNGVEIAEYLAEKKALTHKSALGNNEIILTSDTVVWAKGESLAKAKNAQEAREMLQKLSGQSHEVITAFCLLSKDKKVLKSDKCKVFFKTLTADEIEHYISTCQPFDKAGAYGIQEWIGMIGINHIEGSYFTVMGLPTHMVYRELLNW